MVNGKAVDAATIGWYASKAAYQAVAAGALFVAILLMMGIYKRDRADGSVVYILSRNVTRTEYVFGRAAGVFIISSLFMFILHLAIFVMTWISSGGMMTGFLTASAVCSLNVLLTVLSIAVLSLLTQEVVAALIVTTAGVVSFISDTFFHVMNSNLVRSALPMQSMNDIAVWRIIWPKFGALQIYSSSLIGNNGEFHIMGPVHPGINIACYIIVMGLLLHFIYKKQQL
jgi:ABC-type transport system involved in multi-copper enzyme maturation permease subunit